MRRARKTKAVRKEARGTWIFFPIINGKRTTRKLGLLRELSQEHADQKAEQMLRDMKLQAQRKAPVVSWIVEQYRIEKAPELRHDTWRSYESRLRNHIIPKWGGCVLPDLQARPVQLWLQSLKLAPRTKGSIRGLLSLLWDFAMWRGDVATQRNPMGLVTIKGSSKRTRKPRCLTVEEFQMLIGYLEEPFRTAALICICFGLRISECLALRWSDVDWLNSRLTIERGIVRQRVGDTKTEYSERPLAISAEVLDVLKGWKQTTQFARDGDWVFASPAQIGRLPWSADAVNDAYLKAAKSAGIGHVSTHCMRHTYRSWLDAAGTPLSVQQKLMRHADIRTTMNVYGDVVTDEMEQALGKVARMAVRTPN